VFTLHYFIFFSYVHQWSQPGVHVPPGVSVNILGGKRKHPTGHVKLKKIYIFFMLNTFINFIWHLIHYFGSNFLKFILDVDYRLCMIWIIHQQLWRYKVEEKLHLGVHQQKSLNTAAVHYVYVCVHHMGIHKYVHNTCIHAAYEFTQHMHPHMAYAYAYAPTHIHSHSFFVIGIERWRLLSMKVIKTRYSQQKIYLQSVWMTVCNLNLLVLSTLNCLGVKQELWDKLVIDNLCATIGRVLYYL
jgi:hypothetical protein